MNEFREELCDCEVGDVVFESIARHDGTNRIVALPRYEPRVNWNDSVDSSYMATHNIPRFEFERVIAMLPGMTAKVRVWKRIC